MEENKNQEALQSRVRHRLFQQKITHAKFYSQKEKELEFLVLSLINIVGKENVNFLRPVFFKSTGTYVLEVDIKIPETLLNTMFSQRYQVSNEPKREETQ